MVNLAPQASETPKSPLSKTRNGQTFTAPPRLDHLHARAVFLEQHRGVHSGETGADHEDVGVGEAAASAGACGARARGGAQRGGTDPCTACECATRGTGTVDPIAGQIPSKLKRAPACNTAP